MAKTYKIKYDLWEASAELEVDPEVFTQAVAKSYLDFFYWSKNPDWTGDLIVEFLKKLMINMLNHYHGGGVRGLMSVYSSMEGWPPLDGSEGILLVDFEEFEFDVDEVKVAIQDQ